MSQAAPPPPSPPLPRVRSVAAASALTAAAWNRQRPPRRGLAHWPRWLRSIPENARAAVLVRVFAALFLLLPGGALVYASGPHLHAGLLVAVLVFVTTHGLLHALAVWRHLASRPLPPPLRRIDANAAWLLLAAALVPVALRAADAWPKVEWAMAATAACLLVAMRQPTQPGRAPLRSALQMVAIVLLLGPTALLCLSLPPAALAWLLAGACCQMASLMLQLRFHGMHSEVLRHSLLVLGSALQFIAVALISAPATS